MVKTTYNISSVELLTDIKLQLDAARIVTGLPIFTKTDKYTETGWITLSSRRHNRKLQLFYNIKNGHAPNYLRELIPPTVQSTTIYPLRNGSDLIIPFCKLLNLLFHLLLNSGTG